MIEKKGVGLNPQSQIHYIDHLAVVCVLMDIPLLFLEEKDWIIGQQYYPTLNAQLLDFANSNPEYLIRHYDVFFMSDLWDRGTFHEKYQQLEERYQKNLRHVHCPHGFSDKGFYLKKGAREDILLIYGQNMIDLLKYHGVFEEIHKYVITGNYRLTYFLKHRPFYEKLIQNEVLSKFEKKQPIILYAPTWMDLEDSTTFFETGSQLLASLPRAYNLIVKLHPRLELDNPGLYYHIIGNFEDKPNIVFLKDFPLIYPILAHTDLYIGDMSSIGYDFLYFDRPMFFLNKYKRDPKEDRGLLLFKCGVEVVPELYPHIYEIIEHHLKNDKELFSDIRKEMYRYTFGEQRSFQKIKEEIIAAYQGSLVL